MGIRDIILGILYLITIGYAAIIHEPKVHEELDEHPPEYIRTARHLGGQEKNYQRPVFNYRTAVQQDLLKSRYHRQQQVDYRSLKLTPANPDTIFEMNQRLGRNRGKPMSRLLDDNKNDWKPFQPKFLNSAKPIKPLPINPKKKITENIKQKDTLFEKDLEIAGSEPEEQEVKSERPDEHSQYIYITPSILKNNFGLDSKTTEQILQNSSPENAEAQSDKFQISELQGLLGKNPEFQLEGLQKLLQEAKPIIGNNGPLSGQKEVSGIQIEHNGSPSLENLQQQIDAVNKAQEERALAAAQKQAEAHVQAQHQALALAQKKAQEEALAKIAAHNQGISTLSPTDHLEGVDHITAAPLVVENHQVTEVSEPEIKQQEEIDQNSLDLQHQGVNLKQPELSALQERPVEETVVLPGRVYNENYAATAPDLRNAKPRIQGARGRFYRPVSITEPEAEAPKLQYLSEVPNLYDSKEVQNYSPVSPYTPHSAAENEIEIPKINPQITEQSLINLQVVQEQKEPSAANGNQLYEGEHAQYDDLHQYAAKYAFGYRILDEEHGNDFGHEEQRNGKLTKGHYYVRLPDGRKQRVEYYADKSGYHARVSYENVGVHPYVSRKNAEHLDQSQPVEK